MLPRRSRAEANRHRLASWLAPVTLRLAGDADDEALRRLAERDTRPVPEPPLLVAERDGTLVAAVSLRTGETVADPFARTAEALELLRCHAGVLRVETTDARASRPQRAARPRLRFRLAGGTA